jgi:hypothetical protein
MTQLHELETAHREAIVGVESTQRALGGLAKDDPARTGLKADLETALARAKEAKEAVKRERTCMAFAGIGSPLDEAIGARLPEEVLLDVRADALDRQRQRDRAAVERRQKSASPTPTSPQVAPLPPPKRCVPEVYVIRRAGARP